ncbi:putative tyrosine protein phosphatase MIH1 [Sporobolomyces salmoneus]|uniref:putative tyrosine protein phosphatase MIH1 n=1 Tax=Sporobolomyces salmoneus TaxID=183962 RepID=UPI00317982C9
MLSSSPPSDRLQKRGASLFQGQILVGPSSPSYQDGEISPTFDASFASSMSINSDERGHPSPFGTGAALGGLGKDESSPVMAMDISPAAPPSLPSYPLRAPPDIRPLALFGRTASGPVTTTQRTLSSKKGETPFLDHLFQQSAPATQTTFPPIAPLSIPRSTSPDSFAPLASTSTTSLRPKKVRSRPSSGSSGHSRRSSSSTTNSEKTQAPLYSASLNNFVFGGGAAKARVGDENVPPGVDGSLAFSSYAEESRHPASTRPRSAIPTTNRLLSSLAPPVHPVKRRSDSSVPKTRKEIEENSPFRMEIDGASPRNLASPLSLRPDRQPRSVSDSIAYLPHAASPDSNCSPSSQDGAQEGIKDIFHDDSPRSPVPATRKRLLEQENSPTPASSGPFGNQTTSSLVRRFDKVNTIGGPVQVARRQRSSLGLNRRSSRAELRTASGSLGAAAPILSETGSTSNGSSSISSSFNKRLATQAHDGRPSHARRNSRRALSVADAASAMGIIAQHSPAQLGNGFFERDLNAMGSPQPAPIPSDRSDYFALANGSGKRSGAPIDLGPAVKACMSPGRGSPITGFCEQELRGKALPCFYVKDDGLMRITPETLHGLQSGRFANRRIASYQVIDCRFQYEFNGGHIMNAINLSLPSDVEGTLLKPETRPRISTSEEPLPEGKTILIFHCEFSATRAPTTVKHLRNLDRIQNQPDYPKCHYPEVYVLQGGYEAFYRAYPEHCIGGYVSMDDRKHADKRTTHLEKFRKQKGVFSRASSFTYGQAEHASALLNDAVGGSRRPVSYNSRKALDPDSFKFPTRSSMLTTPSGGKKKFLSVHDEDGEGDSSISTNGSSPCGAGGSPCPPASKSSGRPSLKLMGQPFSLSTVSSKGVNTHRPLTGRAKTSAGILPFAR